MRAIFHVSGHGFGHATRMAALAAELRRLSPGLRVTVRSDAPAHLFTREDPAIEVEAAALDPGVRQLDGLRADWPATLAAHEAFLAGWDAAAEREAVRLRELRAALLVGDIPPLAFEAAARAGVPSAGVSNFSWDWILADAAGGEPRWAPILARYRAAYARCGRLHKLPMGGVGPAFPVVEDSPLLVRGPRRGREEARAALGLARESRPCVLVSFGGFGAGPLGAGDDLRDFLFLGYGPVPEGFRGEWRDLTAEAREARHIDLAVACDVLLGKPGYGTVTECIALRLPMLYVPRDYRENGPLVDGLRAWGRCRELPAEDLRAGRWRAALEALLADRSPWTEVPLDGLETVARRLLGK